MIKTLRKDISACQKDEKKKARPTKSEEEKMAISEARRARMKAINEARKKQPPKSEEEKAQMAEARKARRRA